jgi:hypothetical protein
MGVWIVRSLPGRRAALAALVVAAALLVSCGGDAGPPEPPQPAGWGTARATGLQPEGDFEVAGLSDGSVLLAQRRLLFTGAAPEDTDEVVEAVVQAADGRELQRRELSRVRGLRCCVLPASGIRIVADGRGGAYLAWTERSQAAPYRRTQFLHYSSDRGFGTTWPLALAADRAVVGFDLAVDAQGTATLLWAESVPDSPVTRELGATTLRIRQATPLGPQGEAVAIGPVIPVDQAAGLVFRLALSPAGARSVAWAHSGTGEFKRLWAVAAAPGAGFGAPTQVLDPGLMSERLASVRSVALDVDDSGRAALAWAVRTVSPDREVVGLAFGSPAGFVPAPWTAEPGRSPSAVWLRPEGQAVVQYLDPTQTADVQPHLRLARLAPGAGTPAWQAELTPAATQPYFVSAAVAARLADGSVSLAWLEMPRTGPLPATEQLRRRVWTADDRLGAPEPIGPSTGGSGAALFRPDGPRRVNLFWVVPGQGLWRTTWSAGG